MTVHVLQELLSLSQEFDRVIRGLERTEREPTYMKEMARWAKAHAESAQCANDKEQQTATDAVILVCGNRGRKTALRTSEGRKFGSEHPL
jgi:hypothetical protein